MFLSSDDVQTLTGYKQPARQIRWLAAHAWRFEVGGDGCPKVLRSYAEGRMGAPSQRRRGPNLEGLSHGKAPHEVAALAA
jgi:hypothetical protein